MERLERFKETHRSPVAALVGVGLLLALVVFLVPAVVQGQAARVDLVIHQLFERTGNGGVQPLDIDSLAEPDHLCNGEGGVYLHRYRAYRGSPLWDCRKFTTSERGFISVGFDNKTTSIRFVGSYGNHQYVAKLYEHADYKGRATLFQEADPWLGDDDIGDNQASSIVIRKVPPSPCEGDGVYLYEHAAYQGRCRKFTASDPELGWGAFDEIASSIKFVGGYKGRAQATLYKTDFYQGPHAEFAVDDPDFGDDTIRHDRASSIRIERVPYYVAPGGSDDNPGTLSQPWQTIGQANATLQPGDTVYVRAGTYNERIAPADSGQEGRPITYAAYPGEEVILAGEDGAYQLIDLAAKHHVVIEGFTISYSDQHTPPCDANKGEQWWQWVLVGGDHNVIRNCTIERKEFRDWCKERGIDLDGAKHTLIEGNTISGLNIGLFLFHTPQYNVIRNNRISSTSNSSIHIDSSLGTFQGNLITGNTLESSAYEDGIQFMSSNGDLPEPQKTADISNFGTIIRGNVIRNHGENAIDLKGAAHVVIEGNTIYGIVGSNNGSEFGWNRIAHGSIVRGSHSSTRDVIIRNNVIYDSAPATRVYQGYKVYHNTFVGNNRDYTGPDSDWETDIRPGFYGIRQQEPEDWARKLDPDYNDGGISILNNISVGHNSVETALILDPPATEPNYIDHNLYFNSEGVYFGAISRGEYEPDPEEGGEPKPKEGHPQTWRKRLFFQWFEDFLGMDWITGKELNSIAAQDPLFVNAPERPVGDHTRFDFRLQSGSPAIDRGGALTWTSGKGSEAKKIRLEDAGFFTDGYGIAPGDLIMIGGRGPVEITSINYQTNFVTVDRRITWSDGDPVYLPYAGSAPDMGAYECAPTLDVPVKAGTDDAEERQSDGHMALSGWDLELGDDGPTIQWVGLRFQDLAIPRGADITRAYVTFSAADVNTEPANMTFHAQAADDAPAFAGRYSDLSSRPSTFNWVRWEDVPSWTSVHATYDSPDLSDLIEEITGRPGWRWGNAVVLTITGGGTRVAESYEGATHHGNRELAPTLHIESCQAHTGNSQPAGAEPAAHVAAAAEPEVAPEPTASAERLYLPLVLRGLP